MEDNSDIFVLEIQTVPKVRERLEAMKFKLNFQEYSEDLKKKLQNNLNVISEIRNSKLMKKVFQQALAVINT